jgi:hypothetical protein
MNEMENAENRNNQIPLVSINRIQNVRNIARTRKCSFCRQEGHTVNTCNDERFVVFEHFCRIQKQLATNSQSLFQQWIIEKYLENPSLVKSFAVKKCGATMRTTATRIIQLIVHYFYDIVETSEFVPFENESLYFIASLLLALNVNLNDELNPLHSSIEFTVSLDKEENMNELHECCICYESYEKETFVKLNCHHTFCKDCMYKTLKTCSLVKPPTCAYCREKTTQIVCRREDIRNELSRNI